LAGIDASSSYRPQDDMLVCRRAFSAVTDTIPSDTRNDGAMSHNAARSTNGSNKTISSPSDTKRPSKSHEDTSSLLPPLTEDEYNPRYVIQQIKKAHLWNQGRVPGEPSKSLPNRKYAERKWDYEFVRSSVDLYERHLQYILNHLHANGPKDSTEQITNSSVLFADIHPSEEKCKDTDVLIAPSSLAAAVRALTRSRFDTPILSRRIRNMERLIGSIGWTPITEDLSYRLLEANGKAGNVRRTLALLELRRRRGYEPKEKEFLHVITSIKSAQLPLRRSRNIYLHETALSESTLDNPTRYLDAILVNMSQRGVRLTQDLATNMLSCYSSTGRTGRALHYFYKVVHDQIEEDGVYIPGPHPTHLSKEGLEEWKVKKRGEGLGRLLAPRDLSSDQTDSEEVKNSAYEELEAMKADDDDTIKTRVRMVMHPPPPFHKIPSAVKGASLSTSKNEEENVQSTEKKFAKSMTKLEWELERDWSLSLTAAFAFADSLTQGACGHDPIELNIDAWNALIKACCYRGAFHRALKILNETLPQKGIDPDSFSYNTIMAGLARVGDINSLRELLVKMTNRSIPVDKYTVQAVADGLLNMGDISGASTIVQDIFNQHDTLPPYTTHLKIIEFALANNLIFEAKRHVYFVQQLWKWQPSQHHSPKFCSIMEATKRNPKLNKGALQQLFRYYGEELKEKDFF
jgi:pentatricopeptide repeat protein